jgi:hypothetical protein
MRLRYKLTVAGVRATTRPGHHADGEGLYLQVTRNPLRDSVRKSWVVRYRTAEGRVREIGIGSLEDVSLAEARATADRVRRQAREGRDLIEERVRARSEAALSKVRDITFRSVPRPS